MNYHRAFLNLATVPQFVAIHRARRRLLHDAPALTGKRYGKH